MTEPTNGERGVTLVAVVGPASLVDAGIECLVDATDDLSAIGAGATPEDAIAALADTGASVVLFYASAPITRGPDLITAVRGSGRSPAFAAVVDPDDAPLARACLGAGADACVATSSSPADLMAAVRACRDGRTFVAPEIDRSVAADPVFSRLTSRERDVLRLVAGGATSQETADRLAIAYKTVDSHRQNITKKLGSKNVADLVKHAIRAGLIEID